MLIDLKIIFYILIIHWIGDFMLQTDKQAKGKSSSWHCLLTHTATYSYFIGFFITLVLPSNWLFGKYIIIALLFGLITFVLHTITDYFTSRLNKKLLQKNDTHNFFVSVGGDQILHYLQLFLTYYYVCKL
jgi:hypothetical protein